jgi:hypothetical protein
LDTAVADTLKGATTTKAEPAPSSTGKFEEDFLKAVSAALSGEKK